MIRKKPPVAKQMKDVLATMPERIIGMDQKNMSGKTRKVSICEGVIIMPNIRVCIFHGCLMKKIGTGRYTLFRCKICEAEIMAEQRKRDKARNAIESQEAVLRAKIPKDFLNRTDISNAEYFAQLEARTKVKRFFESNKRGCVMIGGIGTGKTLLACHFMQKHIEKGGTGYYSTLFDIIIDIKDTWQLGTSTKKVMDFFASPDVLIVDEVDDNYGTKTEYLHISRIINRRTADLKKTIVIGNESIKVAEKVIGDKAMDRLMEGEDAIYFEWDSYRKAE